SILDAVHALRFDNVFVPFIGAVLASFVSGVSRDEATELQGDLRLLSTQPPNDFSFTMTWTSTGQSIWRSTDIPKAQCDAVANAS
ncbi:MAG TPA: hypothetical protein VKP00_10855, partial [Gemmatimonadaceae bacterium]|nr:hypothetical protein [Gemmatimonadaceae bacterium]